MWILPCADITAKRGGFMRRLDFTRTGVSWKNKAREQTSMKVVQTSAAPAAIGPYSQAFISGGFVFTSGQIPITIGTGEVMGATITEQAKQAIENLAAVLKAANSDLGRVVKTTCFLVNMDDFGAFNAVYEKYFTGKPARSTVAVKQLPRGVLVEIEAVAEVAGDRH